MDSMQVFSQFNKFGLARYVVFPVVCDKPHQIILDLVY